jgi:hypothetical protein
MQNQQRSETPSTAADQSSCNGMGKDTFCSHAFLYLNSLGFKPLVDQDVLNRHIKQLYDVFTSCFLSAFGEVKFVAVEVHPVRGG